jgi:general secretion pathway protein A
MRDLSRMYLEYYGLNERPFSLVPDPEFLFWARPHSKAYTMLEYGIASHAPITLITGEIGSGKTTLVRKLLSEIPMDYSIGLISNATGGRGELLHWVMMSLGQEVAASASYVQIFRAFQEFLIDEYAQGRRTALIFDEAQNLTPETLEELRMFSNINADKDELLQLILVGQPELRDMVRRPELQQFAQRIASEYHLRALSVPEAAGYIDHRMAIGGAQRKVFDADAALLIHAACRGVPRLINQLCDYALVYGFAAEEPVINARIVREVLEDRRDYGVFSDPDAVLGDAAPRGAPRVEAPQPEAPAEPAAEPTPAWTGQSAWEGDAHAADVTPTEPEAEPESPGLGDKMGENVFYGVWGERKI